jgi:hypothetical protein
MPPVSATTGPAPSGRKQWRCARQRRLADVEARVPAVGIPTALQGRPEVAPSDDQRRPEATAGRPFQGNSCQEQTFPVVVGLHDFLAAGGLHRFDWGVAGLASGCAGDLPAPGIALVCSPCGTYSWIRDKREAFVCFLKKKAPSFQQGLNGPWLLSILRGGIAYIEDLPVAHRGPWGDWILPLESLLSPQNMFRPGELTRGLRIPQGVWGGSSCFAGS